MPKYRAFTTLELLIAIGVLVILLGIVVLGARSIIGGSRARDTKVRLEALAGMLTEFEANTGVGLKQQPVRMFRDNAGNPVEVTAVALASLVPPKSIDIWYDADPTLDNTPTTSRVGQPLATPGDVTQPAFEAGKPGRFRSTAVYNTQIVMGLITGLPAAQQMLNKLPPTALIGNPNRSGNLNMGSILFTGDNRSALRPPIVVDAWDNPIIFVPASGLTGVTIKDHGAERHVITSKGVLEEAEVLAGTASPAAGVRPFFASAGPDGDFTTGDDNVYSFEN